MSFWTDIFGSPKRRKKKKASKKVSKLKEYVIFDKYDDKLIMRVKASTESKAAKMVKSDDHRIMTAARWDKEHS